MGLGELNLIEHVLVSKADLNKLEEMVRVLIEKDSNAISSTEPPKDILFDADVCKMLNIKPQTLSSWRCRNKIPFYKMEGSDGRRGKCYYKLEEIKALALGVKHASNTELSDEADSHMLLIKRKRLLRKNKKNNIIKRNRNENLGEDLQSL